MMTAQDMYERVLAVDALLDTMESKQVKREDLKRFFALVNEQELCLAVANQLAA